MNALQKLAAFVHGLDYGTVTPHALERVTLSLADSAGCMIYGSRSAIARSVKETCRPFALQSGAKVFFEDYRLPAPYAALANGSMIASMAYDDLHHGATVHCGCIAVPATLAALDMRKEPVSGKEFVTALCAGYETMIRVSFAVMPEVRTRGYHPASVAAPFCAAAVAGKLLGLDEEQLAHAFGIAGVFGSGLMSAQLSSSIHGMQAPYNGMHGINGVMMSQNDVKGDVELFDDTYGGYLKTLSGKVDTSPIESAGQGGFECGSIGIKFYPTAGSVSSALDGISAIAAENGIALSDIEDVTVRVNRNVYLHCGFDYVPGPVSGAQMHIGYCASALLCRGKVTAEEFEPEVILDPAIGAKMKNVHVVHDESMDNLGKDYGYCARVEATAAGRVFEKEIVHPRGSADNPLTREDVKTKFLAQCARVYDAATADAIFEDVLTIADAKDAYQAFARIR